MASSSYLLLYNPSIFFKTPILFVGKSSNELGVLLQRAELECHGLGSHRLKIQGSLPTTSGHSLQSQESFLSDFNRCVCVCVCVCVRARVCVSACSVFSCTFSIFKNSL
ncbi:mCG145587 [Mus musculus]|nr:mCG145587 [Mus musculus]